MITKLKIKNYKSLENIEINLQPLTVLIGPNNAGKSNIFDSLKCLRELLSQPQQNPFELRGGFEQVVFNGEIENRRILWDILFYNNKEEFNYILEYAGGKGSQAVKKEILKKKNNIFLENIGGQYKLFRESDNKSFSSGGVEPSYPIVGKFGDPGYDPSSFQIREIIQNWKLFFLDPIKMKTLSTGGRSDNLKEDGSNLWQVIHTIFNEEPEIRDAINDTLKLVSGVKGILSPLLESGHAYGKLVEENINFATSSWSISDGILRLLALEAISYFPRSDTICIEEPENGIHPHLLETVADILKSTSKETQVIISTHSVHLLNYLAERTSLDSIIILWKEKGKTRLESASNIKDINKFLSKIGFGDLWFSGSIGGIH